MQLVKNDFLRGLETMYKHMGITRVYGVRQGVCTYHKNTFFVCQDLDVGEEMQLTYYATSPDNRAIATHHSGYIPEAIYLFYKDGEFYGKMYDMEMEEMTDQLLKCLEATSKEGICLSLLKLRQLLYRKPYSVDNTPYNLMCDVCESILLYGEESPVTSEKMHLMAEAGSISHIYNKAFGIETRLVIPFEQNIMHNYWRNMEPMHPGKVQADEPKQIEAGDNSYLSALHKEYEQLGITEVRTFHPAKAYKHDNVFYTLDFLSEAAKKTLEELSSGNGADAVYCQGDGEHLFYKDGVFTVYGEVRFGD